MAKRTILKFSMLLLSIFLFFFATNADALISIVAAENIYGEIAQELSGPYVSVVSILNNPFQDPHLFTITPSTAKVFNQADIIIYNGADYDPWVNTILASDTQKKSAVINVSSLVNVKPGDNPHIWYMPITIPTFAKALVTELIRDDPQHQSYYINQLQQFNQRYQIIFEKINRLKQHWQNTPVIATEPLFGYMAKSLGLKMHGEGFQINMMNDVPPTVSQIKSFEDDLKHHTVRLLIYNNQVSNPLTKHMLNIAEEEKIPVLGISELIPPHLSYIEWIMQVLNELEMKMSFPRKRESLPNIKIPAFARMTGTTIPKSQARARNNKE